VTATTASANFFMWYLLALDFAALPPSFPDTDRSGPAVRTV
jgi:hypothetical protein